VMVCVGGKAGGYFMYVCASVMKERGEQCDEREKTPRRDAQREINPHAYPHMPTHALAHTHMYTHSTCIHVILLFIFHIHVQNV